MRKGEIARDEQFLLFSQCFLPYMALIFHFKYTRKCRLQICFNLDQSKFLSSGNGLKCKDIEFWRLIVPQHDLRWYLL